MLPTNMAYRRALAEGNRNYQVHIIISNSDMSLYDTFDNDDITEFSMGDACTSKSTFALGGTYAKNISFALANFDGAHDDVSFYDKGIGLTISLNDWVLDRGFYIVTSQEYDGNQIRIEAADAMIKFNKLYTPSWLYGTADVETSCGVIISNICNQIGIELATQSFSGDDETIYLDQAHIQDLARAKPTCRDMLGYIAELAGGFARIGCDNKLYIYSFPDLITWNDSTEYNGGSFFGDTTPSVAYDDGDTLNGGSFTGTGAHYSDGATADGGTFDNYDFHMLDQSSDYTSVQGRALFYDGVQAFDRVSNLNESVTDNVGGIEACTSVLKIENNPLLPLYATARLSRIYNMFKTFSIMPFSGTYKSDLSREAGDKCVIFNHRGMAYHSLILSYSYSYGNSEQISAQVDEKTRTNIN